MNIQFIVVGWHMNQSSLIDGLFEIKENNPSVKVFWSCHREPTDEIKNKFEYKVFFNGGEECGAYDQAIDYLDIDDETVCFFMHDDLIIKNWEFINMCINTFNKHPNCKVIGNGIDYAEPAFDPFTVKANGIKEEFDNKRYVDYVKPENQHLFDKVIPMLKVRPSFICMKYKDVKAMGGFEPRKEALVSPIVTNGVAHYRNEKGIGSFGNLYPALVCYKMNKVFGKGFVAYMSDRYLDSDFIYEMGRGELDPNNPMT